MDGQADPLTTPHGATATQARLRRVAPFGVAIVAFVIVGALAGVLFVQSQPDRSVGWNDPGFHKATAQTATVVVVRVGVPSCSITPSPDDSWLVPAVSYTPSAVTITMHTSDAFERSKCWGTLNGRRVVGYILDVYNYIPVQLSEPLGGRALFDGSTSPPAARPYH